MIRRAALALLALLAFNAAPAVAQVAAPTLNLPGRYVPGRPGAGVDADAGAIIGRYVKEAEVVGGELRLSVQTSTSDPDTVTYDGQDGVIESGLCSGNDLVVTRTGGLPSVTIQEACVGSGGAAGEANVQVDWNVADTASDAFILNKPAIPDISDLLERSDLIAGANITLTPGTGNTVTIASSGGGVTDGVADSLDYSLGTLTIGRSVGADLTENIDEIVRRGSATQLPTASTHENRVALDAGSFLESRNIVTVPAHTRSVTLPNLAVGGLTVGGTTYATNYAGGFASPPNANNYSTNEFIWDRGSQVWLLNGPNPSQPGSRHWIGYSGPTGFRHGTYLDDADAESHATAVGEIFIVGQGSSQRPKIVSAFTAAAAAQTGWVWVPIGVQSSDIPQLSDDNPGTVATVASAGTGAVASRDDHRHAGVGTLTCNTGLQCNQTTGAVTAVARLSSAAPEAVGATESAGGTDETISRSRHVHAGVTSIAAGTGISISPPGGQGVVTVTATGGGGSADGVADSLDLSVSGSTLTATIGRSGTLADLSDTATLPAGIQISAYSSTATYSRGSDNSFVTDGGELYIYTSGSERSSGHDPGEHPEYWFRVSHGAEFVNVGSGSHRYKAGTFLLIGNDIYLATTNITTPRDSAYVIANAGDDQEFLPVNEGGGGVSLTSTITPEEILVGGNSSIGLATTAARADHDHAALPAAPVAVGAANSIGSLSSFSRSNHVHAGVTSIAVAGTGLAIDQSQGAVTITGSAAAAGTGGYTRTLIADAGAFTDDDVATVTLSSPLENGTMIEIEVFEDATDQPLGDIIVTSETLLALPVQTTAPDPTGTGEVDEALSVKIADHVTSETQQFGHNTLFVWRGSGTSTLYMARGREEAAEYTANVYKIVFSGGGGSGSGAAGPPMAFFANWADKDDQQADAFSDTAATVMQIETSDIVINQGGFTVETTNSLSTVEIPEDGLYVIGAHAFLNGSAGRSNPQARIGRTRGSDTVYGIVGTGGYLRSSGTFSGDASSAHLVQPWNLEAGDKVFVQVVNTGDQSLDLDGDQSWISIVRQYGGGADDGVVTAGSVSGTTLTLTRSVGADVTITGLPSGGGGGGASLSDDTPDALSVGQSGAAGSGTEASRSDHAHAVSHGVPVAVGSANAEGSGSQFVRRGHIHAGVTSIAVAGTGISVNQAQGAITITGTGGTGTLSDDTPDAITPDQAGSAGSALTASRADHAHNISAAAPVAISSAASEGTATTFARSDHVHDGTPFLSGVTPLSVLAGGTGLPGAGTRASRTDHRHASSVAAPVAIGASLAEGTSNSLARADHVHSGATLLANDFPLAVQGGAVSAIGTSNRVARQDHRHHVISGVPAIALSAGAASAVGSSGDLARATHVHGVPVAVPVAVGTANAAGTATTLSRSDHVHEGDGTGSGGGASLSDADPDTITPDQAAASGSGANASRSDHAHAIAAAEPVIVGTANAEGTSTSFARADHAHAQRDLGTTSATAIRPDADRFAGTSSRAARVDHQHGFVTATPVAVGDANAEGSATNSARADHVHQGAYSWVVQIDTELVPELNDSAISVARVVLRDGGTPDYLEFLGWTDDDLGMVDHLPVGGHIGLRQSATNIRILRVEAEWDSTNERYEVASVNTGILTEAASGTDTELLLTAQSPQAVSINFSSAVPPASQPGLAGSMGSGTLASRSTHRHGLTAAAPTGVGTANAEGTATSASRSDHVHVGVTSIAVAGTGLAIDQASGAVTITGSGSGGGSTTFTALTDTPASITADQCVMGNSAGDALEFGACATGAAAGGVTLLVDDAGYTTGAGASQNITVAGWRNCAMLAIVFDDGSVATPTTGNQNKPFHGIVPFVTEALDNDGSVFLGVSQNEGLRLLEGTGDVIGFQWTGTSPQPAATDTIDIWCINAGVGPAGPAGAAGTDGAAGADGTDGAAGADGADGQGVPTGGSDGQILAKASGTDYDTEWIAAPSGGGAGLSDSIPVSLVPDLTSAPGSGTTASRHDHVHGIAAAAPSGSGLGTANGEGSSTAFARSDHSHAGLSSTNPVAILPDASGSVGSNVTAARGNHRHAIIASAPVGIGTANLEGTGSAFSRNNHVHDIPDDVIHGGALIDNTIPTAKYGPASVTSAKIAADMARDSELPTAIAVTESGGDLTVTITMSRRRPVGQRDPARGRRRRHAPVQHRRRLDHAGAELRCRHVEQRIARRSCARHWSRDAGQRRHGEQCRRRGHLHPLEPRPSSPD